MTTTTTQATESRYEFQGSLYRAEKATMVAILIEWFSQGGSISDEETAAALAAATEGDVRELVTEWNVPFSLDELRGAILKARAQLTEA